MGLQTSLHAQHLALGAHIVDVDGWDMPRHYRSQLEEHGAARSRAGMFDLSHMGVLDVRGEGARDFLRRLLTADVACLQSPGRALHACMLREDGGVLDDLVVHCLSAQHFRLVVNAACRDKDLAWIQIQAQPFGAEVVERRDLAIIAVQGPQARARAAMLLPVAEREIALALPPYGAANCGPWFVARTGYAAEDGFEILLPASAAPAAWTALQAAGIEPCGLGARDTLRLEAGRGLYGNDLDEAHHPLESGLEWTVAFEPARRAFIGRTALERVRAAPCARLVGLVLEERCVLRARQRVFTVDDTAGSAGEITSGAFSPTLNRPIALARVPHTVGSTVQLEVRGRRHLARVVQTPFVRHGQVVVEL